MPGRAVRDGAEATGKIALRAPRIHAVDGIRALAVLAVIAFHLQMGIVPAGFVGVDVFFVISGYVISLSLNRHREQRVGPYVLEFYKRRVVRLVPALACCLLVVSLLSLLFVPESWLSKSNDRTGLLAFIGAANFALLQSVDGYFQMRTEFNPFVHTWSLGVEEQFYVLFPLLFWWWNRAQRGGERHPAGQFAAAAIPLLALASLLVCALQTQASPQQAYYMLPSRFWELAAGALLFRAQDSGWLEARGVWRHPDACGVAGLVLLAVAMYRTDTQAFPFPWALCAVLGTALLISACLGASITRSVVARALGIAPVAYIGRISYSLYLWHWPVVCLMRWTSGFSGLRDTLVALGLTAACGAASYHCVELPFQRSVRLRNGSAARIAAGGAAACIAMALCTSLAYKHLPALRLSVVESQPEWSAKAVRAPQQVPAPPTTATLFVLGDSHALAYERMANAAAPARGLRAEVRTVSGCAVAGLVEPHASGVCEALVRRAVDDLLREARPGDVILLASLRSRRLSDQWGVVEAASVDAAPDQPAAATAVQQAGELVGAFVAKGLTVIIDAPKPVFRAPLFRCSDWFNRMNPVCAPGFTIAASELRQRDQPVRMALQALQTQFPQLLVWDPFPVLCPGETCSAQRDGKPLFFDGDHLSGHGNDVLLPSFTALLKQVGPAPPPD